MSEVAVDPNLNKGLPSCTRRSLVGGLVAGFAAPLSNTAPAQASIRSATIGQSEERLLKGPQGQVYKIQIAQPHKVDPDLPLMIRADRLVPVYVLDGASMFPIIAGLTRMMQYGGSVPPCLVVGIGYENDEAAEKSFQRAYDLTPTKNGRLPNGRYGGAAEFRSFLASEVKPLVEKSFIVNPDRSTLVGHSLSGMFALQTAVAAPSLFANILALSPSLWFDNDLVLHQLDQALTASAALPHIVALAGDREQEISGAKFNMSRNVELLREKAVAAKRTDTVFARLLQDTTHHTIQGPGFAFGLRKLLDPTPPSLTAGCLQMD
jgi:hypothetical protein